MRKGTGYGDKGSATIVQFLVLAAIAAAMVLLFAIPAKAQTLGHCLLTNADGTCKLVVQPDIIKPVLDLNLKTGKVSGGIDVAALGACWGATYQPAAWYASGFDLCFNLVGSQTSPTVLYPSGTVHFLSYGMIGAGPYCAADGVNGAFECQWHLLLGGNLALDFGRTPVQRRRRRQRPRGTQARGASSHGRPWKLLCPHTDGARPTGGDAGREGR